MKLAKLIKDCGDKFESLHQNEGSNTWWCGYKKDGGVKVTESYDSLEEAVIEALKALNENMKTLKVEYKTSEGVNEELDKEIEKLAMKYGLEFMGCGYNFADGVRDLKYENSESKDY